MTKRITLCILLALSLAGLATAQAPPAGTPARKPVRFIGDRPESSSYWLPASAVLARVDNLPLTSRDFIESYYAAYAPDRPDQDSLGRVEWLNSMVNKEVLGSL